MRDQPPLPPEEPACPPCDSAVVIHVPPFWGAILSGIRGVGGWARQHVGTLVKVGAGTGAVIACVVGAVELVSAQRDAVAATALATRDGVVAQILAKDSCVAVYGPQGGAIQYRYVKTGPALEAEVNLMHGPGMVGKWEHQEIWLAGGHTRTPQRPPRMFAKHLRPTAPWLDTAQAEVCLQQIGAQIADIDRADVFQAADWVLQYGASMTGKVLFANGNVVAQRVGTALVLHDAQALDVAPSLLDKSLTDRSLTITYTDRARGRVAPVRQVDSARTR